MVKKGIAKITEALNPTKRKSKTVEPVCNCKENPNDYCPIAGHEFQKFIDGKTDVYL